MRALRRLAYWGGAATLALLLAVLASFADQSGRRPEANAATGDTAKKADGTGVELACPPEIEASIYKAASGLDIYDRVRTIRAPVTVIRAKQRTPGPRDMTDFSASPTWDRLAGEFTHGRDVFLPDLTHFIPMQDPKLTADYIEGRR